MTYTCLTKASIARDNGSVDLLTPRVHIILVPPFIITIMHLPQRRERGKREQLAYLKPTPNYADAQHGPTHHFSDSVEPQTPFGVHTPVHTGFPHDMPRPRVSPWLRWAVEPHATLPLLLLPVLLFLNWELLAPPLRHSLGFPSALPAENPFAPFFLLSHRVAESDSSDSDSARYTHGPSDLPFLLYHIFLFSFLRQIITLTLGPRVGRFFGITRRGKLERFGEQAYAFVYFGVFGAWGVWIMSQLPTWWYRTRFFWIDYPHTTLPPALKRYYLTQCAYWLQQFLVLVLGLEKPRKDYMELVLHHLVTLFLVGTSYVMDLTYIGSAVYMSMDIPDTLLALSKLLNYIQYNKTNNVVLAAFVGAWVYFRHYLNLLILWSVWWELDGYLPPTVLPPALRYSAFTALVLLQMLNLFWGYLIVRVIRVVLTSDTPEDVRSDGEDEDDECEELSKGEGEDGDGGEGGGNDDRREDAGYAVNERGSGGGRGDEKL
ncbi:longevity assurance proteins LAG1/LAC1 [Mycena galericulata]|nr:longevity assurance proteins LAG1/LAC1 [Mycena galericulata]